MVYRQPRIYPGEWHTQTPMELWHINGSPNIDQKTSPYSNQERKKRACKIVDITVAAYYTNKTERNWKEGCCLGIKKKNYGTWRWRLYRSWLVHVVRLKRLEDFEVGGRVETMLTTALLRTARLPQKSPGDMYRHVQTCCHSNSRERPSANADVKNSKGVYNTTYWSLTIRINYICTTQNLSRWMRRTNSHEILTYNRITLYQPDDHTLL